MRNVISICRRELLAFFVSPIAYFVITGFVLLAGYFFFNLLGVFNLMVQRYQMFSQFRPGGNAPNLNQWVVEPSALEKVEDPEKPQKLYRYILEDTDPHVPLHVTVSAVKGDQVSPPSEAAEVGPLNDSAAPGKAN